MNDPYLLHLKAEFEDNPTLAAACHLHTYCKNIGAEVPEDCQSRIDKHIADASVTYRLEAEATQQKRLGRVYVMRNLIRWVQGHIADGCLDLDHAFSFIASDLKDNPALPSWKASSLRTYYFNVKKNEK